MYLFRSTDLNNANTLPPYDKHPNSLLSFFLAYRSTNIIEVRFGRRVRQVLSISLCRSRRQTFTMFILSSTWFAGFLEACARVICDLGLLQVSVLTTSSYTLWSYKSRRPPRQEQHHWRIPTRLYARTLWRRQSSLPAY